MNGKPHIRVNMKPDAWAVQVVQKPSRVPGSVSAWPSSASARWGGRAERVAAPCLVPLGMATTRTTRAITEHDAALRKAVVQPDRLSSQANATAERTWPICPSAAIHCNSDERMGQPNPPPATLTSDAK